MKHLPRKILQTTVLASGLLILNACGGGGSKAPVGAGVKTLTQQIALTPSNCKGHVEQEGKDTNGDGILDPAEVTKETSHYDNGTPLTLAELKSKIANKDDVTSVNTCEITDMSGLFRDNKNFNQNISTWNTGLVTNMNAMFSGAAAFNQPLDWDTGNVEDMRNMFHKAKAFNQALNWDTSNVTSMLAMFAENDIFNKPLVFDTSNVISMRFMFLKAKAFNQPLDWDTANVTDMYRMFENALAFNQPLEWDTSLVTSMGGMFSGATAFNQPLNWETINVTNLNGMFSGATAFNQVLNWDTSNVTSMGGMFNSAIKNTNPGVEKWDFSSIEKNGLKGMFTDVTLEDEARVFILGHWYTKVNNAQMPSQKVDIGEFSYNPNNALHRTTKIYIDELRKKGWTVDYSIN